MKAAVEYLREKYPILYGYLLEMDMPAGIDEMVCQFAEEYAASQSEPSTVTEGHPIALITPYKKKFDQWVHDFGINGQEYIFVNSIDHIRGRYFSAIQRGLSAWEVDPDIVDAAKNRIRTIGTQQTQAVGVSESKIFEIIADKFPDYNVPYCTEVAEAIATKLNQKK